MGGILVISVWYILLLPHSGQTWNSSSLEFLQVLKLQVGPRSGVIMQWGHPLGAIIFKYRKVHKWIIWGVFKVSDSSLDGFWKFSGGFLKVVLKVSWWFRSCLEKGIKLSLYHFSSSESMVFCVSLSPPNMFVPTYYVCPHLLCLSPPIMSVPTYYVCPHQLCLSPPINYILWMGTEY